ncbi:hypothetical protein Tco_0092298 [Tanacetum coccineum]
MTDSSFSSTSDNEDLSDIDLLLKVVEYDQSGEAGNLRNRNWINCERDIAEKRSRAGYFRANGDPTKYLDLYLRRRYRMSRKLFLEIVEGINTYIQTVLPLPEHFNFFVVRPDCTGLMGFSVIMKWTFVIRQLAYGTSPDALDEYLQMGEHCTRDSLDNFMKLIVTMGCVVRHRSLDDVVENPKILIIAILLSFFTLIVRP